MSPRLTLALALALSLALHGSLVLPDLLGRLAVAPPRPPLQAVLRLPPTPAALPAEPLLKNTLDPQDTPPTIKPAPASIPQAKPGPGAKREVRTAQRKLSEHLFYPAEAVARGIEGEVRLIVRLSADGTVENVSIAASSGYPLLDNAAIKAAFAMGRLSGASARELIVPVIFRLE